LVYAHADVVPVDDQINLPDGEAQWSVDPFGGIVKNFVPGLSEKGEKTGESGDYVFGRGAIDLKNMTMGWMEALDDLAATGFQPQRTIYLALGSDEEVGGYGARFSTRIYTRGCH
jgi:carboxypeptidase PM20D1